MKKKIIIGSRGSLLALAQSRAVGEMLKKKYNISYEIKKIVTKGDIDLTSTWKNTKVSLKSMFTKEIERELLDGSIDLAVHSMKDMPAITPDGLVNGGIPKREDQRDVLITRDGKKLMELPSMARIGTSSHRREVALKNLRDDIDIVPIRGNIHTRIKKLIDGEYDGIILALAGLKRCNLEEHISEIFTLDEVIPAPSQGALCIQFKDGEKDIEVMVLGLNTKETTLSVDGERAFSKYFGGGCHSPIGCYSTIEGETITLKGMYHNGDKLIISSVSGPLDEASKLGETLATNLKEGR